MDTIQQTIQAANESARKVFGSDICIMIARCPAWGNDDVCAIVQGKRQVEAAAGFAKVVRGAKLQTSVSSFMGEEHRTTSVTWPA
jgi:hypothetical protein